MIEQILPSAVATAEARDDPSGVALFPEEEVAVSRAVDKRRREFTTARACARSALDQLGLPPAPVPTGARGEPIWPAGVVGSITHCAGFRACALARAAEILTIGIDAEPDDRLPDGVLADISAPSERVQLSALREADPTVCWDRLLFSAKEAVYKAWFPLTGRWLGFEDALLDIDPRHGAFSARLLVPGPAAIGGDVEPAFAGRWLARDGLLVTAIAVVATG